MKTVSQLGSGKQPVGTIAYMKRAEHLMQCRCNVERGIWSFLWVLTISPCLCFHDWEGLKIRSVMQPKLGILQITDYFCLSFKWNCIILMYSMNQLSTL